LLDQFKLAHQLDSGLQRPTSVGGRTLKLPRRDEQSQKGVFMSVQSNPYAPPTAHVDDVVAHASDSEAIRREHIKHEASIRSVGILYYLGAVLMGIAGAGIAVSSLAQVEQAEVALFVGLGVVYAVLAVGAIFIGRGIRAFRPWARITGIVLGFIGLLGFPIGTLVNAYILYLMMSAKGKRIFAPDYPAIVAATPHIRYRTSIIVWVVLGLLVAGIVLVIVASLTGG
jgi:Ca2+/Na+ antiporter